MIIGRQKEKALFSLESSRWSELEHTYGQASDIPSLLKQLVEVPDSSDNKEPWFPLWSSLAHQGDVYSASFAAVPACSRSSGFVTIESGTHLFWYLKLEVQV